MPSPYDYTKLKKHIDKSIVGMSYGFNDPTTWINTGCYVLNYLISDRFDGGIPLEGKFTMFAGDSGCLPSTAIVNIRYSEHSDDELLNRVITKNISVGELRQLFLNDYKIEIDTPDGFQSIISWWDKGYLQTYTIRTLGGLKTRCAYNHLIQLADESWLPASDITIGDPVITKNGIDTVMITKMHYQEEECYDFEVNHPNHRYWGDGISSHNSGKSYVAVANIIKWCQENNVWPVLVDTENALDMSWLDDLGVKTDDDHMHKFLAATVDDVSKFMGHVIDEYKNAVKEISYKDRPKMVIIIDSLGMLITPNQDRQFMEGDQKGDMGIKAKQITAMLRVMMTKIASQPIGLIATNHVFDSQDQYKPDSIPGGKMLEFASSVIVQMNKYLLKEDEDGTKLTDGEIAGIRTTAVVRKSRYSKPFERMKISIPYTTGMDPYSGLFDLFEKKGIVVKQGNRYTYTSPVTGEVFLEWKKNFKKKGILDQIMEEWSHWEGPNAIGFDTTASADGDEDE
jgi:RecA/RadA recombinase